jgi:hypothetical protein
MVDDQLVKRKELQFSKKRKVLVEQRSRPLSPFESSGVEMVLIWKEISVKR